MENEYWAKLYEQAHCIISGRGLWHFLIDTSIGQLHIVEYEDRGKELIRFIIDYDNDKAEKKYQMIAKKMIDGKL